MIPFNYHHLYYFYAVTRHGSISKAAQELKISQPALSAQIKLLESYLGIRLFEREKRKITLTADGHAALAYARTIFDTGQEFLDTLRDRSQKGRIRVQIGVTNSTGKAFANALVGHILRAFPHAHILLYEDALEKMTEDLKDHRLDLLLSDLPIQASAEEGIRNKLVGRIPVVFGAHPKFAREFRRFPRCLEKLPMILPTVHSGLYPMLQEFFSKHQLRPHIVSEIQDAELLHRMALDGVGVAPLNAYSVKKSAFKGKLLWMPRGAGDDMHESIYLISKERKNQNPVTENALEHFRLRT